MMAAAARNCPPKAAGLIRKEGERRRGDVTKSHKNVRFVGLIAPHVKAESERWTEHWMIAHCARPKGKGLKVPFRPMVGHWRHVLLVCNGHPLFASRYHNEIVPESNQKRHGSNPLPKQNPLAGIALKSPGASPVLFRPADAPGSISGHK